MVCCCPAQYRQDRRACCWPRWSATPRLPNQKAFERPYSRDSTPPWCANFASPPVFAGEERVGNFHRMRRVQVSAIRLRREHNIACLPLLPVPIRVVEIRHSIQPGDVHLFCCAHAVCVQGLLKRAGAVPVLVVTNSWVSSAPMAARCTRQVIRPPRARSLIAYGREAYHDRVSTALHRVELPGLGAYHSVRGRLGDRPPCYETRESKPGCRRGLPFLPQTASARSGR